MCTRLLTSALGLFLVSTPAVAQTSDENLGIAVKHVRDLCSLGDQYTLSVTGDGMIAFRSLVPGARFEAKFDRRAAEGATGYFDEEIRQHVDARILDCIENQFSIILKSLSESEKSIIRSSIHSAGGGLWGNWADSEAPCPSGTYAYAFRLRVEPSRGGGLADDTALNALQLKCRPLDEDEGQVIRSDEGQWGQWGQWAECPHGEFLYAYALKVEPDQGYDIDSGDDDTAANDIAFGCRPHQSSQKYISSFLMTDNGGRWGSFQETSSCPNNMSICGFITKIEPPLGEGDENDDTSFNDVRFYCCD